MRTAQSTLLIIDMLTTLEKSIPRHMRIQKNAATGQWSVNIPVETIQEVGWEKGIYVRFLVQDENRITIEKVGD
jgi:hypothetical protein